MEKKTALPITVIKYSMETTLGTFMKDVESICWEMDARIKELGLEIAGHPTWVYQGCDGSAEKVFGLDICIPIKEEKGDSGKFSFEQLPACHYVSIYHKGPWSELAGTYAQFVPQVLENGYQLTDINREVYVVVDHNAPQNCLTEVQIGIQ